MPLKKPSGLANLNFASSELNSSYSMSDTGSFSSEQFKIGQNGITKSPLTSGEISSLRLDQLKIGHVLGRGASSQVRHAIHTPSGKELALKVLQAWGGAAKGLLFYQWDQEAALYGNLMDRTGVIVRLPAGCDPWSNELRPLHLPPLYGEMVRGVPDISQDISPASIP